MPSLANVVPRVLPSMTRCLICALARANGLDTSKGESRVLGLPFVLSGIGRSQVRAVVALVVVAHEGEVGHAEWEQG